MLVIQIILKSTYLYAATHTNVSFYNSNTNNMIMSLVVVVCCVYFFFGGGLSVCNKTRFFLILFNRRMCFIVPVLLLHCAIDRWHPQVKWKRWKAVTGCPSRTPSTCWGNGALGPLPPVLLSDKSNYFLWNIVWLCTSKRRREGLEGKRESAKLRERKIRWCWKDRELTPPSCALLIRT